MQYIDASTICSSTANGFPPKAVKPSRRSIPPTARSSPTAPTPLPPTSTVPSPPPAAAFPAWAAKSPAGARAALLLKVADLIDENAARLAMVRKRSTTASRSRETTLVDVPLSSDHFRYFAGCLRAKGGSAVMIDENTMSIVLQRAHRRRRPDHSVELPAPDGRLEDRAGLAAGNTLVIKSSSTTPLFALRARQAPQPGAPRRRRQHRLRPRRPHGPGHA